MKILILIVVTMMIGCLANAQSIGGEKTHFSADFTAPKSIPDKIYRGGTQGNPNHVKLRPGEDAVSFRDSLSNALPNAGKAPQPVLRPKNNYIEVDRSKLPPASVVPDGGKVINGHTMPHGHVSVTATPEEIVKATTGGAKFPK